MGPKSKAAVVKVLGALTNGVRSIEAMQARNEALQRESLGALGQALDELRSVNRRLGEMVASHTRANTSIIEIQRDVSDLKRHTGMTNGAAE